MVRCPHCGLGQPLGTRDCLSCGQPLSMALPQPDAATGPRRWRWPALVGAGLLILLVAQRCAQFAEDRAQYAVVNEAVRLYSSSIAIVLREHWAIEGKFPAANEDAGLPDDEGGAWPGFHRVAVTGDGRVVFEYRQRDGGPPSFNFVIAEHPSQGMGQWVKVCGGSDLRPAVREWLSSFCAWDGSINSYAPPQQPTPRRTWGEREEPRAKTAGASGLPLPERPRLPGDEVLEAIGRDDPAALEALRGQGTDPCAPLPDGQTALAAAVRGNQAKSLTLLLRRGCDLDAVEAQSGRTPLMLATAARNVELARQLLVAGAAVTPVAPDGQDAWSLVGGGSDAVSLQLRTMLLAKGASVDAAAAQGSTLLMRASGAGSTALIDWLLSRGAKPDLADAEGRTALMHATLGRNAETVLPLLLGRGAAINARDQAGRTALGLTAEIGDRALRERLIRQLQAAGGKP